MKKASAKSDIMDHWKPEIIFSGAEVSAENAGNQYISRLMTVLNSLG
jgi:hypothetical protein